MARVLFKLLLIVLLTHPILAAVSLPGRSPVPNATSVGAAVILQWIPEGENLLTNGGFENGLMGWQLSGSGQERIVENSSIAAEGQSYLSLPGVASLDRVIEVPQGPGRKLFTFRTVGTSLGLSAQIFSIAGQQLKFISLRWQGIAPNSIEATTWMPTVIDLSDYAGQTIRMHFNFEGLTPKRTDDFRLLVVPENVTYRLYMGGLFLGETNGYTWSVSGLVPGLRYDLRVAPFINGVQTEGTNSSFTTASSSRATRLRVDQTMPRICPTFPVPFQVIPVNEYGFTNAISLPATTVSALGANADITAHFTPLGSYAGGVITGSVVFPDAPNSVKILARSAPSGLPAITGESEWFQLLPQGSCIELLVAESAVESAGEIMGKVRLLDASSTNLQINLTSFQSQIASVPSQVTLPAGATEISFPIALHDDQILTGSREVVLRADVPGHSSSIATLRVMDDERSTIHVTGPPIVREGFDVYRFDVTVDPPPQTPVRLRVRFNHPAFRELLLTEVTTNRPNTAFNANTNDFILTGSIRVIATVEFENWEPAQIEYDFIDNEPQTVTLASSASGLEGDFIDARVILGGTTLQDRLVTLASSDPTRLSVTPSVTIPAGAREAMIQLRLLENTIPDGRHTTDVTVASQDLIGQTKGIIIEDNDAFRLELRAPPGPWERNEEIPVRVHIFSYDNIELPYTLDLPRVRVTDSQTSADLPFRSLPLTTNEYGLATLPVALEAASPAVDVQVQVGSLQQEIMRVPVWENRPRGVINAAFSSSQNAFIISRTNQPLAILDAFSGLPRSHNSTIPDATYFELSGNGREVVAVGAQGSALYRLDLGSGEIVTNLIHDRDGAPLFARYFTLVSGDPNRLVLFRENENISYADIALYEGGQEISSERAGSTWGQLSVGQSDDGRNFHVAGHGDSLEWYARNDNNLIGLVRSVPAPPIRDWFPGRVGDVAFGENRFLTLRGVAVDARSAAYYGSINNFAQNYIPSAYDKLTGNFASLVAMSVKDYALWISDGRTLRKLKESLISEIGVPDRIIPAQEKGWIVIDEGNFRIVQDPIGPSSAAADLRLTLEWIEHPSFPRVARARLHVENAGPDSAENALIAVTLPPGTMLVNRPEGTVLLYAQLSWPHGIGSIPAGAQRTFDFDLTSITDGDLQVGFWLGSDAHEIARQDNNVWFDWHITVDESTPAPYITSVFVDQAGMLHIHFTGQAGWRYHLYRGDLQEARLLSWVDELRPDANEGEFTLLPAPGQYYFLRRDP